MPLRPPAPCTTPGCPTLVRGGGRCDAHLAQARREAVRTQSPGYAGLAHRRRFRLGVLRRDVFCQCPRSDHRHGSRPCPSPATQADHWPLDKRELMRRGMDANDPRYGRGLCHGCHSSETARLQPGGWNRRR
jgi:5-methylcytosine-specific restriction protein A